MFHALTEPEIDQIARLLIDQLCTRLAERGVELTVEDSALKCISREGTDLQYGARPLRRAIQRMIEDALSEELLAGAVQLGDRVRAFERDGEIAFETLGAAPDSGAEELLPAALSRTWTELRLRRFPLVPARTAPRWNRTANPARRQGSNPRRRFRRP